MIKGDSTDYNLLEQWTKDFDCQGFATVEIGVREGLGSKIIMDNVKNNYIHIGIDPYGNLEYQHYDDSGKYTCDYTDAMRDQLLKDMEAYKGRFTLYNDTDIKFMNDRAHQNSRFAFVHFDGPHTTAAVLHEALFFANRSRPGTRFVFDDVDTYDIRVIQQALTHYNFYIMERGENKICLERSNGLQKS